jgi:hypothetical protein
MSKATNRVMYVDHANRADLIKKYVGTGTAETVTPTNIVETDIVWDGTRPLAEVTEERNLDFCISSHVIEHVPDVIGWLQQIGTLLRCGSLINMAIPDRDRGFDFRRAPTKPADLVQAYLEKRTRPNGAQVFDHVANALPLGSTAPRVRPDVIMEAFRHAWAVTRSDTYMDVHCSVFTQRSFLECFEVLAYTGLINLKLRKFFPTRPGTNEFIVSLEYGSFPLDEMGTSFRIALDAIRCTPGQ